MTFEEQQRQLQQVTC